MTATGDGASDFGLDADKTAEESAEDAGRWVTATIGLSGFRTDVAAGNHAITADEPVALGGTDLGPTPYEFLLTALATCTVMTLRMYADRKQWPLASASVALRSSRSHERDCENCAARKVDIGRIERRVDLGGPISQEQRVRLMEIADRCPVKQTLERGISIEPSPTDERSRRE